MAGTAVAIIESQIATGEALALRLNNEPDFQVVYLATSAGEARGLAASPKTVNVAVIADRLADEDGLVACTELRRVHPNLGVVILADQGDANRTTSALVAGARGWVERAGSIRQLIEAIRMVANGQAWLPPHLLGPVIDHLIEGDQVRNEADESLSALSSREREVLAHMVNGESRSEIAQRLYLSENTVRTHQQSLMRRLGVHSALAAVAVARRASE
ncbi:MAG: response regulator transcription factor [Actinomycetes bacterium]